MKFDTFFYNLTFATGFPNKQTAYKYRVETNRILCHDDIISRQERDPTQKQFSERTGIAQTDISKPECGNANPSLRTRH